MSFPINSAIVTIEVLQITLANYVGINIGSISVNLVHIDDKNHVYIKKETHFGKPEEVLEDLISKELENSECFYGISGSFGEISEIAVVERGIKSFEEKFDVILSLGGEAFVLYVLDKQGNIINVLGHDKCAAGSGEFFVQQVGRLDLSLEEAIKLAHKGKKIQLASRCSVHCKSDITHKLNKGEATLEDVLASVIASMVNKVKGLIIQSRVDVKRLLLIGGVSLNEAFVKNLKEDLPEIDVVVKDVSPVFEAYGTALLVKDNPTNREISLIKKRSFSTLPSLRQFSEQIKVFETVENKQNFDKNAEFILGVDVGSTTTKAVLLDPSDYRVIGSYYGRTSGNPVQAARKCINCIFRYFSYI
ncbi:MAG: BadF/BadG/BcrA/BcrD ATPase family protein [Candidatus Heimdallarchaeaceae archaeon]